jgi:hypothetical protein
MKLRRQLLQTSVKVGRRHIGTLMRRVGIEAGTRRGAWGQMPYLDPASSLTL